MADSMDLVQQREAETLERQIKQAVNRPVRASALLCGECGEPIPEARRVALKGTSTCVTCQEVSEMKGKHYRGAP